MSHLLAAARHNSKGGGSWTALSGSNAPPSRQPSPHDGIWTQNDTRGAQSTTPHDSRSFYATHSPSKPRNAEHDALLDAPTTNDSQTWNEGTIEQREAAEPPPSQHASHEEKQPAGDWRPYALRPAFLGAMAFVSLAFAVTLAVICWYSVKNNGLRKDTDTSGLLVARRYLPTILAVFFTQMLVIVSNDIKRTEPFARLARFERLDVKHTLLYTSKPWWSMIREGFVRERNSGRIGWVLVLSSLVTGISILSLSTLSSSLLASEPVLLRSEVDMQRFSPVSILLEPRRQVYLRTTSGFLFNASTSMWVSDDHVISPFGTMDFRDYPDFLPEGNWEMETKVLQMDSTCKPMQFKGFDKVLRSSTTEYYDPPGPQMAYNSASYDVYKDWMVTQNSSTDHFGFSLDTDDGCHIRVLAPIGSRRDHRIIQNGGLFWTNLSSSYITYDEWAKGRGMPVFSKATEWSPVELGLLFDFSENCLGRNLLMVTTPWANGKARDMRTEGFQVRAEICTPRYFEVMTNVTASVTSIKKSITLDNEYISKHRSEVSSDLLNMDMVQELTFSRDQLGYLSRAKTLEAKKAYEGLTEALSAMYSFDTKDMLKSDTLSDQSIRLNKRFFGELLLSAITEERPEALKSVRGQSSRIEQRIVVVAEVAVTLSVLLLLVSCYLLFLYYTEWSRRRPLRLSSDPATTFGCGAYLQQNAHIFELLGTAQARRTKFHHSDPSDSNQNTGYHVDKAPQVGTKGYTAINKAEKESLHTWKPAAVRSWSMLTLLVAFVLIAVAIIVLQSFASRQLLYRSAFIYQLDLSAFKANLSPQSVLATLLAVGVSMWWDAIDKTLRSIQPFLSMSASASDVRYGAALSYQAMYWSWASVRAALNSHWLLSLVTFGTTLCQVLIVSMAAMFERGPGIATSLAHVNSTYGIRQAPFAYNHSVNNSYTLGVGSQGVFLQDAMRIKTSDWLYSALDQITLDAQQPDWSRDGWSFTSLDVDNLPSLRSSHLEDTTGSIPISAANSTLITSALRAQLRCEKVNTADPSWFENNEIDLFPDENSTEANKARDTLRHAGYILPSTVFNNSVHETSIFSRSSRVQCCSNETNPEGRAAIGYWSQMNTSSWWGFDASLGSASWIGFGPDTWPPEFAVKWIVGPTTTSNVTVYTNGAPSEYKIMQFEEVPPMAFLICKPVIEKADTRVVLAHGTGEVLDFQILSEPQEQLDPWTAHFRHANESNIKDTTATVSYGSYFLTQLLGASSSAPRVLSIGFYPPFDFENLDDDRFNIRDKEKGYNMDFMSYANLYQANMDPMVLLDTNILLNYSQRTFQTFFQHFASQTKWLDGQMMAYEHIAADGVENVEVTISQRLETLNMVPSATWLSITIIAILVVILGVLIVSLKIVYPHDILRNNIACLADVLALIEGSEGILWFAERHDIKTLKESGLHTRLGWFKDRSGTVRWGIELVDAPGVTWIEQPETLEMNGLKSGGLRDDAQSASRFSPT